MKKMIVAILLFLALLALCGCGAPAPADTTESTESAVLEDEGFVECAQYAFSQIGVTVSANDLVVQSDYQFKERQVVTTTVCDGVSMRFFCVSNGKNWFPVSISNSDINLHEYYWLSEPDEEIEIIDWKTGEPIREELPIVTHEMIASGEWNGKRVYIDCAVCDVERTTDSVASFTCWVSGESGHLYDGSWHLFDVDEDNRFDELLSAEDGDVFRFTLKVESDGSYGGTSIERVEKLDRTENISKLVQSYKDSCEKIPCEDVLRNPDDFYGRYTAFSGKVFQIVEEDGDRAAFLLDTGEEHGIAYITYYRNYGEGRILEGDSVTVYGQFYKLTSYTSMLGTTNTVPELLAQFMDAE